MPSRNSCKHRLTGCLVFRADSDPTQSDRGLFATTKYEFLLINLDSLGYTSPTSGWPRTYGVTLRCHF